MLDMYFDKFDVLGQYLVNIWSMFVQQVSVQVYMSPTIFNAILWLETDVKGGPCATVGDI